MALKKTGSQDLAEDLVHDTFLSLYRQKETISAEVNTVAYLYVILKNKIYSHYRQNVTHQQYAEYIQQVSSELDHSTQNAIESNDLEKLLTEEIELLPQQCKLVFTLSRKEHLSNKEIARRLLISENTVEQHMRRALRQLKGSLAEYLQLVFIVFFLRK